MRAKRIWEESGRVARTCLALVAAALLIGGVGTHPGSSPGAPDVSDSSSQDQDGCGPSSSERVEAAYERLEALLSRQGSLAVQDYHRRVDSLVTDVMALDAVGRRAFGRETWSKLSEHRREEFTRAVTRNLRMKLLAFLQEEGGVLPDLRSGRAEPRSVNGGVAVEYWLANDTLTEPATFYLTEKNDGTCGIMDLHGARGGLTEGLRERVKDLRDDYSYAYMIAEIGDYGYVVLEDFERTPVGELPVGWDWKDKDDDSHKPYRVRSENGNKYLEATDEGESVILGREIKWNLDKYPLVSFRVRVNRIPEGADERYDDKVDSAAGIYFTVNKTMFGLIPESVKYVWSSTLPVGAATIRDGIGRPWQVVFGSGREGLGEWRTYYFDLKQAYRDTFGGDPPSKPLGVGVLSDANSMNDEAYADYDDIRALEKAPEGVTVTSGVEEILEAG